MSFWDWASGAAEIGLAKDIGQKAGIIPDTKRQQELMNEQIKAYREQSALTRNELNKTREEQDIEKKRIAEKQIRSLRRSYRPAGILGAGSDVNADMSPKLGG